MKTALAVIAALVLVALLVVQAKADLIYIEDFQMVGERSNLLITFHQDAGSDGKITMEVKFGEGLSGLVAKPKIKPITDPKKFRDAMDKFLKTLNDPKKTSINIGVAMSEAGWDMSD